MFHEYYPHDLERPDGDLRLNVCILDAAQRMLNKSAIRFCYAQSLLNNLSNGLLRLFVSSPIGSSLTSYCRATVLHQKD